MPNIIAGKTVVKEFIQDEVKPEIISDYVNNLLKSKSDLDNIKTELTKIKNDLGGVGASKNTAEIINKIINED